MRGGEGKQREKIFTLLILFTLLNANSWCYDKNYVFLKGMLGKKEFMNNSKPDFTGVRAFGLGISGIFRTE